MQLLHTDLLIAAVFWDRTLFMGLNKLSLKSENGNNGANPTAANKDGS